MTNGTQCTQHQKIKAKRADWWGPEHVGKSGENSAVILAQINDEEKLTEHMKFVRDMAPKMGMKHKSLSFRQTIGEIISVRGRRCRINFSN